MWTVCCCSICEFSENWYRKGHTSHIGRNEVIFMDVLTSFSVSFPHLSHPMLHHHFLLGQGMLTLCVYPYSCNNTVWEDYCNFTFQKCHFAVTLFPSETITLRILLVRTKNFEGLMWKNDTLRKYTSDIVYVGDFSRTEDMRNTCWKTTHVGMTHKRFWRTMNFSKCHGECGCIIRSGGESTGLWSITFMCICLSIWNASKRLLLVTGALCYIKISINWHKGEYCIRIIKHVFLHLIFLTWFPPPYKHCRRLFIWWNQIPSLSLLI